MISQSDYKYSHLGNIDPTGKQVDRTLEQSFSERDESEGFGHPLRWLMSVKILLDQVLPLTLGLIILSLSVLSC